MRLTFDFPKMPKTAYLFCLLALPFFAQSQTEPAWVFKNEKDNVKVYYRRTSDVHEIKLVSSIKTTLSGLVHLLGEVEMYPSWGYKVMESKVIEKISDTEMYYYSRLDFPWPFSDRDIVMHTKLTQDSETRAIIATSTAVSSDKVPVKKDVVRITNAKTTWKIWPGASGWAYIEYYIYSDPGGNMPDWVVNMAIDMGPRETIKRMRNILKNPDYQAVRLAHIKE
jgi:START domain